MSSLAFQMLFFQLLHILPPMEGVLTTDYEKPLHALLEAAPALANQADKTGRTPLHYALLAIGEAANSSGLPIIHALPEAGADIHAVDTNGDGVLHYHVRALNKNRTCPALFRQFLSLGLDINARNAKGETPLFGVFRGIITPQSMKNKRENWGDDDVWPLLERAGADFFAKDGRDRNLLHLAAQGKRWVEDFKMLVGKGLDPMEQDLKQMNSLDVAAACGNDEVLGLFDREGKEMVEGPKRRQLLEKDWDDDDADDI